MDSGDDVLPADSKLEPPTRFAEPFAVHVYSLDGKERKRVARSLQGRFGGVGMIAIPRALLRTELKGIKLGNEDRPGMIVLCHYNEGRVLLTDQDGMYNDFILEACRVTGGNVFVALAPVTTSATVLANERLVTALAYTGGQQGLLSIHLQQRFLTWGKTPNETQLQIMLKAMRGEIAALEVPASVLEYSGQRRWTSTSFCNLL
ncbi:unnamed protein product [Discosporangium mesarthrocarpum]